MTAERIFDTFAADETVLIEDVDHRRSLMRVRGRYGSIVLPFTGLTVVHSTLNCGRNIRVRYGEVGHDEARYSQLGQARRGARRIEAMEHLRPSVTMTALAAMRWAFGDSTCATHLRHFAAEANTAQPRIEADTPEGVPIGLETTGGILRADVSFGRSRLTGNTLNLDDHLPDLVCAAAPGRSIREVIAHPALGGRIQRVDNIGGGSVVTLANEIMTIQQALEVIGSMRAVA